MKKVLILTVTAGEGHNSIAKAIANKFIMEDHKNIVEVVDIFKEYSSTAKFNFINDGYNLACKYAPNTYNYVYRQIQNHDPNNRDNMAVQKTVKNETPFVLKKIYDFKPDIIYCTHFYGGTIITNIRKSLKIPAICVDMLSDFTVHPYWESGVSVDYVITPVDKFDSILTKKGYHKNQLKPLGFPVHEKFSNLLDKTATREKLGLNPNMFTVLIMKGGGAFGGALQILKQVLTVKTPIQILVVNGHDKEGKTKIDEFLLNKKTVHKIHNLGFQNNIDELLSCSDVLVGKGGAACICEALNKEVPMIIVNRIPQQEIDNKKFLISNHAGLGIKNNSDISKHISNLIANPKMITELKNNIKNIKQPNAIQNQFEFLNSFPKANWKDVNYSAYYKYIEKFMPKIIAKEQANLKIKLKKELMAQEKKKQERAKALKKLHEKNKKEKALAISKEKEIHKNTPHEKLLNLKTIKTVSKKQNKIIQTKVVKSKKSKKLSKATKSTKKAN